MASVIVRMGFVDLGTHGIVLRLSMDIPVPAMLAGRGLRGVADAEPVDRRYSTPDTDVDVDMALPGREVPGVTSPEREPGAGAGAAGAAAAAAAEETKRKQSISAMVFFCWVICVVFGCVVCDCDRGGVEKKPV